MIFHSTYNHRLMWTTKFYGCVCCVGGGGIYKTGGFIFLVEPFVGSIIGCSIKQSEDIVEVVFYYLQNISDE